MTGTGLAIEGACLTLGPFSLRNIGLALDAGEILVLLGPNGAGKSVCLEMIAGFHRPASGRIAIHGRDVTHLPPEQRRVGLMFQNFGLFPHLTVAGNVGFGLDMKKTAPAERDRAVRHHIDLVGLGGFEHHFPHQLSGGMRQRVAIARALGVSPRVLLMDEPFAALDDQNRRSMQDELVRIWQRQPKTVLLVTHSLDEAILLADHIIVMTRRPGRIKRRIAVDLPRPRDEDDPGYIALRKTLRALIREDAGA